jgi:hypothetical protein
MEAAGSSESLERIPQTTWRHTPEDNTIHIYRRENLNSYKI